MRGEEGEDLEASAIETKRVPPVKLALERPKTKARKSVPVTAEANIGGGGG